MTCSTIARDRVGQEIRSTHPYGFRVGEWERFVQAHIDGHGMIVCDQCSVRLREGAER